VGDCNTRNEIEADVGGAWRRPGIDTARACPAPTRTHRRRLGHPNVQRQRSSKHKPKALLVQASVSLRLPVSQGDIWSVARNGLLAVHQGLGSYWGATELCGR